MDSRMKLPVVLTFLLIAIAIVNALDSSTTNVTTSSNWDGMDTIQDEIENILGSTTRKGRILFPLANRLVTCQILNVLYKSARLKYPNLPKEILSARMVNILDNCSTRDFKISEFFSEPFIFPGTNWCGQTNVAHGYHHLGVFNETDSCCRQHDYCDDTIQPGKIKHNLRNPYKTTRSHCKCDEALRKCLKRVDSMVSNVVGYLFFSMIPTQCFDFNYPTTGCLLWKRGAITLYCVKYQFENDQPKKWQWFDKEPYM